MKVTSKIAVLITSLIFFAAQDTLLAYDVDVDSIAYKVILWRNGSTNETVAVTGLYGGSGDHPQCAVQTFRERRGRDTYWTINVMPKENWGVFEVRYPMLFLPQLPSVAWRNSLIYPKRMGQRESFTSLASRTETHPSPFYREDTTGYPEFANKTVAYWARYPTYQGMQFILCEDKINGQGVMIWTPDSVPYVKDFVINRSELDAEHQSLGWRAYISHYPENTGQIGTGFQSPYPVVTTPYTNGWSEAASIYKRWGRLQWWCAKGKLYNRPGTPQWLKDTHLLSSGGWWGNRTGIEQAINMRDSIIPGENVIFSTDIGSKFFKTLWCSAPDHVPVSQETDSIFQWGIAQKKHGIHLAQYSAVNWATLCYEFFDQYSPWTVKKPDNSWIQYSLPVDFDDYIGRYPDSWFSYGFFNLGYGVLAYRQALYDAWNGPLNQALIDQMDAFPMGAARKISQKNLLAANWGQNLSIITNLVFESPIAQLCIGDRRMQDWAVATVDRYFQDYRVSALYFDTYPANSVACYDPNHGHPIGFGKFINQKSHDILQRINANNPGAVIISESAGYEQFMDAIQLEYMKEMEGFPEYIVPLNKFIYHGFVEKTQYPLFCDVPATAYTDPEDFCMAVAFPTHLGYMPGGPYSGGILKMLYDRNCDPADPKVVFLNKTVEFRRIYRDYLAAGEPLPDPIVTGSGTNLMQFRWYTFTCNYSSIRMLPPVQVTKWAKNNDPNSILLALSNVSELPQTVTVEGKTVTLSPFSWKAIEYRNNCEEYYFDVGGPEDTGNTFNSNPGFAMAANGRFGWCFQEPSEEDGYSVRKSTGYAGFFVNLPAGENAYFNYKNAKIRITYKASETTHLVQDCGPSSNGWAVAIGALTGDGQWHTDTIQLDPRHYDYIKWGYGPGINISMTFSGAVSGWAVPITVADMWLINEKTKTDAELDAGTDEDDALFVGHVPGFTLATQAGGYFSDPYLFEPPSQVDGYTVREGLGMPSWFVNLPDGEQGLFPSAPKVNVLYKASVSNTVLWQYCGTNVGGVILGNLLCDGKWHVQKFQLDSRHYDYIKWGYGPGMNINMWFSAPVIVAKFWLEDAVANAYLDVGAGDQYGLNPNDPSDAAGDLDSDGFTNLEEYQNGWNPLDLNSPSLSMVDTDGDGMTDAWERHYGLNPNDDADANGDLDSDGYINLEEYQMSWNPVDPNSPPPPPSSPVDTDGDGMPDSWETQYGLNPNNASDASGDLDNDGHTNLEEYQMGWDPADPDSPPPLPPPPLPPADTDGDGMPDYWETHYGLNPNNASDAGGDLDSDGHTNLQEYQNGWNPTDPNSPPPPPPPPSPPVDTDGDGMPDSWETQYGLNPNNASDAGGDLDSDGHTNLQEYQMGWNPVDPNSPPPPPPPPPPPEDTIDTDGDGMPDYWEIKYGRWGGHTPGFTIATREAGHFSWIFEDPSVVDGYTVRESLGYAGFFVNLPEGEEALYANGTEITVMYKTSESTALYQRCGDSWISIGNLIGDGQWHLGAFNLDPRLYDSANYSDTPDVNISMTFYGVSNGYGVHVTLANLWLKKFQITD